MRLIAVMAANDLRRRLRDRSALITAVVAPFALAAIISLALGATGQGLEARIGVVDADRSPPSRELAGRLLGPSAGGGRPQQGSLTFVSVASEDAAVRDIDAERLGAAVVLPNGFGPSLASPRPQSVRVVRDAERAITGEVAVAVARELVARVNASRLSVAVVESTTGRDPEDRGRVAAEAGSVQLPIDVEMASVGGELELAAYFGPSMAVLFLFLTVGSGARSLLAEQREGTLARLRAAPLGAGQIVAAKTAAVFVLGLASMLSLWLATTVVFGASWGPPGPVLVLSAATVVAIAGISSLVTAFSGTEQQAEGATAMITFTLAILGGNFVTPGDLPDALRRLSLLTPNGWALRSFTDLSTGAADLGGIVPTLAVLGLIGLATGSVAVGLLQRVVRG
jgi:ABC-2 type transport system permease protein